MKTLINIFFTTVFVLVLAYFMEGITIDNPATALMVALVLGLLNIFVKPVIVFFTLPATIFTFGLFLLVINALLVLMCTYFVKGFHVRGFIDALLFSLILSFGQALISKLSDSKK
ncbi:phage holin family protein [Flavobacterium sp. RNTU_13]|uniref:phage holin family protein n=1 Tax=Flavobacterium sp. RNTU_13 TaxID=3375145 RepID=UPI00398867A2